MNILRIWDDKTQKYVRIPAIKGDKGEPGKDAVEYISLGLTGATVGQVPQISAVDESGAPTKYTSKQITTIEDGEETTVEQHFKVWGKNTTSVGEDDIICSSEGYYDKTTGKFVATSTFSSTEFIEISDDTTLYCKYLYDFSAGYAITFFDSEKVILSGIGGTGNSSIRITGNQVIPAGAKYIAVTCLNADPTMYAELTIKKITIANSYKERIIQLEKIIDELQNDKNVVLLDYDSILKSIDNGYYDTNGVFQLSSNWKCTGYIPLNKNDKIDVKLATYNTVMAITYFNAKKKVISGIVGSTWSEGTSIYSLVGEQAIPDKTSFVRISVLISESVSEQYIRVTKSNISDTTGVIDITNTIPLKMLVLGDSYSAMGHWIRGMEEIINIDSLVNLSVVSATVKDRYKDRTTYPYSSRPTSSGTGNTNTLSSQIQKLKRLMAGTDLDSGEKKIYDQVDDYPDVIIIEGGMNDSPDSDEVVETYYNQFLVSKTGYYKKDAASDSVQTTVYLPPSLEDVNRTCFAGAYRYIYEELLKLFPNAQIFITTTSHMNYFTVDPNVRYGTIAEQQRMCANIMSCPVIDWHAEGNLNTMVIKLNGAGTESDPYTPVGGDTYTTDLLHPNALGGKYYGRLAGKVIVSKYLGLS